MRDSLQSARENEEARLWTLFAAGSVSSCGQAGIAAEVADLLLQQFKNRFVSVEGKWVRASQREL